ncbi:CAP domain-containing protein [Maritimibacter sp. DP1N21-5]|uniref:CAP domain-containing protein n=1 Tax=Maritimibacter sp. DP1N21-5 TaxID=2836867 RepID=UPI001C448F08|nr:CAP domain-containing protein [Maritimibacter sp. DP1N21-5]MBV7410990.1 CAP domain-containing protein [Maritimibacter sp. DP1N21-5]
MNRRAFIVTGAALSLAACSSGAGMRMGPDGKPMPTVNRLSAAETNRITYSMVDGVNELRAAAGLAPVQLNAQLTAAAATHSRDMAVQNRPWHFGSDGSSPIDRVTRAGYSGIMLGENISETFETELETLSAWMAQPDTRDIILDRRATNMGFSWFQEENGKIWWTMVMGG